MIDLLKRRWLLLSCAGALFVCSMINCSVRVRNTATERCYFNMVNGQFSVSLIQTLRPVLGEGGSPTSFHVPMLGGEPRYNWETRFKRVWLPLWLPLAAILALIVFREVRWRQNEDRLRSA